MKEVMGINELKPASQSNSGCLKISACFHKIPMTFYKVTHNKDKKCHLIFASRQAVCMTKLTL